MCHRSLNQSLVRATHFILNPWDSAKSIVCPLQIEGTMTRWKRIQDFLCLSNWNSFHTAFPFQFASLPFYNLLKVALSLPAACQGKHHTCVLMNVCHNAHQIKGISSFFSFLFFKYNSRWLICNCLTRPANNNFLLEFDRPENVILVQPEHQHLMYEPM